ncbi:MAG: 2-phosphosulfolactate phosphatase, partial [Gemmatimonadaceae bacterium]
MKKTVLRTLVRWQDADPSALAGGAVVVIDVLRWSTVVVTALAHGAARVEAFATPDEAMARANELGREGTVLGGERGNLPLPGFDLGNSPGEYTAERIGGRVVITTTTNGTQALLAAGQAHMVCIAAFANLGAVAARLR